MLDGPLPTAASSTSPTWHGTASAPNWSGARSSAARSHP